MSLRRVWLGLVCCLLFGCGDDDSGAATDAGYDVMVLADVAVPSADASRDAGADGGTDAQLAPMLPACSLACDRVLDCAVETCVGIEWQTAALAQGLCDGACDPTFSAAVMGASDCAGVMSVIATQAPDVHALCTQPVCASACRRFAECTKAACEGYADQSLDALTMGCMGWCDDESAGNILAVSCDALVSALETNDPSFAAACHGAAGCAELTACESYADKTTACMLANCGGNADAYEAGIAAALVDYCHTAQDCPAAGSIEYINGPSVTCADPPLDSAGPAAPFTAICAGTVGADYADLETACDTLIGCGGGFSSNALCATYLAIGGNAATKATCIDGAADCNGAFACL